MATTAKNETARQQDGATTAGLFAVGGAVAVLSFDGLTGFAELAGFRQSLPVPFLAEGVPLAWLLPVALDAYAVVATRVWLRSPDASAATRATARRQAYGAVGLSVVFNGVYHAVEAHRDGSWLAVGAAIALSVVLPVLLASVAHLAARVAADRTVVDTPRAPEQSAESAEPVTESSDVESPADLKERMAAHWLAEREQGRVLSGAELDRHFGTREYGRRVVRALKREETNR
ncbi:DUF2637 domain-containing protein [Actinoalloteichus hymeniacidonis]|uniref:DUF2637 family protein n=1 Tax=Actinoalloteichus hymeniacidonis TaxID=340345 RepID=A0AAC9HPB6_9PSEU|nr:DUF2637 domain-containing protein [Actinoalloteichus hymeniacidonis]AOS62843.1 hypothetical protein TL08_10140 [Actinoalloteichus hymeniacidonis]MBB5909124.1 hypothetical protein [Actinoalloteichus hymeniacidonis]